MIAEVNIAFVRKNEAESRATRDDARTSHRSRRFLINEGVELVDNIQSVAGPEIALVDRIVRTVFSDVRRSCDGQESDVHVGGINGPSFVCIIALGYGALLEVDFTLGVVVGHSDGDRMSDVGLNDVVESGNLEPRDGVEGKSSRARS